MNKYYCILLLVCTAISIVAEIISLIFPDKLLDLIEKKPEEITFTPLLMTLSIMSLFYVVEIGMLLFSGDKIFRLYGLAFVILSGVLILLRKRLPALRYVIMLESAICLVILLDVGRTIIKCYL
jgi:hypothetical protein